MGDWIGKRQSLPRMAVYNFHPLAVLGNVYLEQPRRQNYLCLVKKKLLEGPTLKRSFYDETEVLDFGWFQQIVMFWVEWDSLISTGVACRTHNSCVHLENLYQKSDKLKRHKFPTKRRKFPTKRRKLFWLFSMHIWTFRCYISAHVPQSVWISKSAKNARMAADTARIPPNSWNGNFWQRRQKLLKRQ